MASLVREHWVYPQSSGPPPPPLLSSRRNHQLTTHQVDITEIVEPEVVQAVGDKRKLPAEEASLTFTGSKGQAAQNPGVHGRGGSYLQAGGHEDLDG